MEEEREEKNSLTLLTSDREGFSVELVSGTSEGVLNAAPSLDIGLGLGLLSGIDDVEKPAEEGNGEAGERGDEVILFRASPSDKGVILRFLICLLVVRV